MCTAPRRCWPAAPHADWVTPCTLPAPLPGPTPKSSRLSAPSPFTPRTAQNELGILEFIHALVETLDKYFENVCELDIMFNLEKAQFILGAGSLGERLVVPRAWLRGCVLNQLRLVCRAPPRNSAPYRGPLPRTHSHPSHRLRARRPDCACPRALRHRSLADEMVTNGCIVETNKANVLKPILLLEKTHGK